MAVTPNTILKILKCPLTLNNKNQLTFTNKQAQYNYFNNLPNITIDNITYQRKDNIIRFPEHIDNLLNYNYVMYQNENYTDKWFYAFITGMRYVNDGMTEISISTDVWQTWQFDLNFKQSFVEREMINPTDDVPGANLEPENLETGEFKVQGTAELKGLRPYYVIAYSRNPFTDELTTHEPEGQGAIINGVVTGLFYCICNNTMLLNVLENINNKGFGESVVAVFTIPSLAIVGLNGLTLDELDNNESLLLWIVSNFKANPINLNLVARPTSIDGYTPVNKKLLTYPYLYVAFNPLNGSEKTYRYENFTNGTPTFKILSEINPNPTIVFNPQNYRGASGNSLSDLVTLNGFPQISWVTDFYSNWLAQNSNIISLRMQNEQANYEINAMQRGVQGATDIVGKSFSLNALGTIESSANLGFDLAKMDVNHEYYVANQMAQIEKQQMLPNHANLGSSATLLGYDLLNDNIFTRYSIKRQFAEKIDKYFSMYGYLTNTLKIPNLNNRPNWNYVKLIGANILGNIPQTDLEIIKNMFNNGITLWHNTNTFLDYSQNNK